MKTRMAPDILLAVVISAAVTAVALRAAASRRGPRWILGTEPAPLTAMADHSRPQPAATSGMHDIARPAAAKPPGAPGSTDGALEQVESIFHELHADGRNALCGVCDSQYRY
jgi:hypothetical protein